MNSPDTRPVVVGVDGTPGSAGALRYAVVEAGRRGAPLHVVHVAPSYAPMGSVVPFGPAVGLAVPLAELETVGASLLDEAAATVRRLAPDLEVVTHFSHGPRASSLVDLTAGAQLMVVGRETRRGLERVLTGATTAAVASRAHCDVVVVPSFWSADHTKGRVVVGVKSRRDSHELLSRAYAEASARGASLTLVTAWELADPYLDRIELRTHADQWRADGQCLLDDLAADWRPAYPDVAVETRVEHGTAATVLLGASADSDLLLVSRRHHALPPLGHLGGVAHAVLRRSDVPVLVVAHPDATEGSGHGEGSTELELDDLTLEEAGAALK